MEFTISTEVSPSLTRIGNKMTEEQQTELSLLKQRADLLGIKYHPSIGLENLKLKVSAVVTTDESVTSEDSSNEESKEISNAENTNEKEKRLLEKTRLAVINGYTESVNVRNARLRKEANRLVRVRITCMNPAKKAWQGEIFTVSNNIVGTVKKFIPFNVENDGWHVPQIILNQIEERQFQTFASTTDPKGRKLTKTRMAKEFVIERLDYLSPEELKQLAIKQAMSHSLED
jgi:hypothetical protein